MEERLRLELQSRAAEENELKVEFLEDYEERIDRGTESNRVESEMLDENSFDPDYDCHMEYLIEEDAEAREMSTNERAELGSELCCVEQYSIDVLPAATSNSSWSCKTASTNGEEFLQCTPMYSCGTCEEVLSSQTTYRQHIREHGAQRFNCIQCNKWFPTRYRLRKHEDCHSMETEGQHQCVHCGRCYRLRNNLSRHIRAAHEQDRHYACWLCTESFGRSDVLKNHMLTHKQERNYTCDQCSQCFKCQRYLESHKKTHRPKDPLKKPNQRTNDVQRKPKCFTCEHCGKISKQLFTHKNHLLTHSKERPYACQTCPKKFRTLCALTTHERIHSGKRPYKCDRCSSSFRQQSHLKEHSLIHDGLTPHVCHVCSMSFTKKNNMLVHMKRHAVQTSKIGKMYAECDNKVPATMKAKIKVCPTQNDQNKCINIAVVGEEQEQEQEPDIAFALVDDVKFVGMYNLGI